MGILDSNKVLSLTKKVDLESISVATEQVINRLDVRGYNTLVFYVKNISNGANVRFIGYINGQESIGERITAYKNPSSNYSSGNTDITETGHYSIDVSLYSEVNLYNVVAVSGGTITGYIYLTQEKHTLGSPAEIIKAINTKEEFPVTTGSFGLDTSGAKITIDDINVYRDKYLKLNLVISGTNLSRTENLNIAITNFNGFMISQAGCIYTKLSQVWQFEQLGKDTLNLCLYIPFAGIYADNFVLRSDRNVAATINYKYCICDLPKEIPSYKATQLLHVGSLSPESTGTIGVNITNTYLRNFLFKSFKYYFINVVPMNSSNQVDSTSNYDLSVFDGDYAASSVNVEALMGASLELSNVNGAAHTDWRKVVGEVLRLEFKINTYVEGVDYWFEIYGVR